MPVPAPSGVAVCQPGSPSLAPSCTYLHKKNSRRTAPDSSDVGRVKAHLAFLSGPTRTYPDLSGPKKCETRCIPGEFGLGRMSAIPGYSPLASPIPDQSEPIRSSRLVRPASLLGAWVLELLWSLELGPWSFALVGTARTNPD